MTADIELFARGELSERRILILLRRLRDSETIIRRMASAKIHHDKYALDAMQDNCKDYLLTLKEQDDE